MLMNSKTTEGGRESNESKRGEGVYKEEREHLAAYPHLPSICASCRLFSSASELKILG